MKSRLVLFLALAPLLGGCDKITRPGSDGTGGTGSDEDGGIGTGLGAGGGTGSGSGAVSPEGGTANAGFGCVVGGVAYASGTAGIASDLSPCGTCVCNAGSLVCAPSDCGLVCASATPLATVCSTCNPEGGCLATITACVPRCASDETCPASLPFCDTGAGLCQAGICQ